MSESAQRIKDLQQNWAEARPRDPRWNYYLTTVEENLFSGDLHPQTRTELCEGDGSELKDSASRPAKMRALYSSSALAVNFFDPWREQPKTVLTTAFGLESPIVNVRFEFKTRNFPVRPRSPNLDLLLTLESGQMVGVESKFSEPYSSDDGHGTLSARYFPKSTRLWDDADMASAQLIADRMRPEWIHLDAAQLLKHMLGLAHDPDRPYMLLYLWFDTGKPDAATHREEAKRFEREIKGASVAFRAITYQELFQALPRDAEPLHGWRDYMTDRYFKA